jgi:gliding motility-associated-like protein
MMPLTSKTNPLNWSLKLFVYILLQTISLPLLSQTVSIDNTSKSANQLVNLLIDNSCIPISNANFSSTKSVAYFNNNNGNFPLSEGIIIRNGIVKYTEGSYSNTNLGSEISTNGDVDLQEISNQNGQNVKITDVAFLEFNFIPLSNNFNFNYLFASNEYGEWQCGFNDVFAILLTNLDTGETINIAKLPETDTNVSVSNIRDNKFNSSCNSNSKDLFSTYNVDNSASSVINMRGYTNVLKASATVIANNNYKLRFVIGDANDSDYDSAVFIEASSFKSPYSLGEDQQICSGEEKTIDSGYKNTVDFMYEWSRNDTILIGQTKPILKVSETGNYALKITNNITDCIQTDSIVLSDLQVNTPNDLIECSINNKSSFNLNLNNLNTLGIDENEYTVFYYNSLDNALNNNPIDTSLIADYQSTANETIYIKLQNKNSGLFCDLLLDFKLLLSNFEATTPNDISACEGDVINIREEVEEQILNDLNAANYSIKYFTSEESAINNIDRITNPYSYRLPENQNSITIWAKLIDKTNCFDIISFVVNIKPLSIVDDLEDVFACTEFILPNLSNGKYYTKPFGEGTPLFPGDVINEQTKIYIYYENTNGCSKESIFNVYFAKDYTLETEYCNEIKIPVTPFGQFYTDENGPNGKGVLIPSGTKIRENTTVYLYSELENIFCLEKKYDLTIHESPLLESLNNVITCDSYELQPITNGKYFTKNNGRGNQLYPGDIITKNKTIYIYNEDLETPCNSTNYFNIMFVDTSVFKDIIACGKFIIPNIAIGHYYTENNGLGTIIPVGTEITSSQKIYYYAPEITTTPNCTGNEVNITINTLPEIDTLNDILSCENNLPKLPTLQNGNYFTKPNGKGTPLFAGDIINNSQTIYIYNKNTDCEAETSFKVIINTIPIIDTFTDIFSCEPYVLPALKNGKYYTESNGQGIELFEGNSIESTQDIYIFNKDEEIETCTNENVFKVHILGIKVDVLDDIIACESYILSDLNTGNYYTEPKGQGIKLNVGAEIITSQTIYIYAENGNRFLCTNESSFKIAIYNKPTLEKFDDIEACGSVTLPTISIPGIKVEYYNNSNNEDLIDINNYTISTIGTKNIYVHAYQEENPGCFINDVFTINILPLLNLDIDGGIICVNSNNNQTTSSVLLESNLDSEYYTINWFFEEELIATGSNYNATKTGTYIVEAKKNNPLNNTECNYNPTEVIVEASNPKFEINFLSDNFVENYAIEVITINEGLGNYVYSLDNGEFQKSNEFYNIKPGVYSVTIKDLSGICNDIVLEFVALKYSKFFTPNSDGKNDTWNISDLKDDLTASIVIYDRYGKLITNIKPSAGGGWNGLNNDGNKMQNTDYWFLLKYSKKGEEALFKSHFALLRK